MITLASQRYTIAAYGTTLDSRYPNGGVTVSGTFSAGNAITLAGSGFGSKTTAAPFYFDGYDSFTVGDSAIVAGLDDLGNDGRGFPAVRSDKSLSGTKSLRMDYLTNQGTLGSMFPRVGKEGLTTEEVFASAWLWWERVAGDGADTPIIKLMRGGTDPAYSSVPRFYESVFPNAAGTVTSVDRGTVDSAGTTTYTNTAKNSLPHAGAWHRIDYHYKLSTPGASDGVFESWVDGVKNANLQSDPNRLAGSTALINNVMSPFDGIDSYGLDHAYTMWVDDFFIDTTQMRVELGNAATLAACTTRYIQPATAWSDGSVTITARPNTLTGAAYLYVFASNGTCNADGYPVTVV